MWNGTTSFWYEDSPPDLGDFAITVNDVRNPIQSSSECQGADFFSSSRPGAYKSVILGHNLSCALQIKGSDSVVLLENGNERPTINLTSQHTSSERGWYAVVTGDPVHPPGFDSDSFDLSAPWSLTDPRPVAPSADIQHVWMIVQWYPSESLFLWGEPGLIEWVPESSSSPPSGPGPSPPPANPTPEPEGSSSCTWVAPYWSLESGGFVVRPEPGRSSVTVECGGQTTEYAAENEPVVRLIRNRCSGTGLRITGAAPGGWYWQNGDQNAAVAPLVCSESLGSARAVVPGGVTADATDTGTWINHDTSRLVGIVPHLAANECPEYVTPYWQGDGGIVARPTPGRDSVTVKVQCGRTYSTSTFVAGDDGVVAALVRRSFCADPEGNPKEGRLTVKGAQPGGWYWISGERNAAVAPLVCPDLLRGPAAAVPGGVRSWRRDGGTFFQHDVEALIGVVPHIGVEPQE